jgi:hypothetical protein
MNNKRKMKKKKKKRICQAPPMDERSMEDDSGQQGTLT